MADETEAPANGSEGSAEGAAAEGEGAAAPAKKKKMLLIISSAVAVVGVLVAVGVVFFMGGEKHEDAAQAEGHAAVAPIAIYDVPEFNLSLLSEDPNTPHFIKIKISLELGNAADMAAAGQLLPRLQDDWGGLLRQMRVADLQGSANLHRLKDNLLRRATQSLDPVEVKAVYIKELLVQ